MFFNVRSKHPGSDKNVMPVEVRDPGRTAEALSVPACLDRNDSGFKFFSVRSDHPGRRLR